MTEQPPKRSLEQQGCLGVESSLWAGAMEGEGQRKVPKFCTENEDVSKDSSQVSLPEQNANTISLPCIYKIPVFPKKG